jgi:hypothetical protein
LTGGVLNGVGDALAGGNFWDGSIQAPELTPSQINASIADPVPQEDISPANDTGQINIEVPKIDL